MGNSIFDKAKLIFDETASKLECACEHCINESVNINKCYCWVYCKKQPDNCNTETYCKKSGNFYMNNEYYNQFSTIFPTR